MISFESCLFYSFSAYLWYGYYVSCSATEGPDFLSQELSLVKNIGLAVKEERYKDAGDLVCTHLYHVTSLDQIV